MRLLVSHDDRARVVRDIRDLPGDRRAASHLLGRRAASHPIVRRAASLARSTAPRHGREDAESQATIAHGIMMADQLVDRRG